MLKKAGKEPLELQFLTTFCTTLEAFELLHPGHIKSRNNIDTLFGILERLYDKYREDGFIGIYNEEMICCGRTFSLRDHGLLILKERLEKNSIQQIIFHQGLQKNDFPILIQALIQTENMASLAEVRDKLKKEGIDTITINGEFKPEELPIQNNPIWDLTREVNDTLHCEALEAAQSLCSTIKMRKRANAQTARKVIESLLAEVKENPDTATTVVFRPIDLENWPLFHMVNSCILFLRVGLEYTDDDTTLRLLGEAGFFHDIGLFTVPEAILFKEEELTEKETDIMRRHTIEGAEILLDGNDFPPAAVESALLHHADPLTEGYPKIPRVIKPSTFCKLLRIVDAYESMISGRPYRPPIPPAGAAEDLVKSGPFFDKGVVKTFFQALGLFPTGSLVTLNDGSIAEVIGQNRDSLLKPKVAVLFDAEGSPAPEERIHILADSDTLSIETSIPIEKVIKPKLPSHEPVS